jgi:hypothetical protein
MEGWLGVDRSQSCPLCNSLINILKRCVILQGPRYSNTANTESMVSSESFAMARGFDPSYIHLRSSGYPLVEMRK